MTRYETCSRQPRNVNKINALLLAFLISTNTVFAQPAPQQGVMHVVLVWLKQPQNPVHRAQIIAGTQKLREVPGVLDLQVGEVITSDRNVVEDSYDVALTLRFASLQALNDYLGHPLHQSTVKTEFVPIMDHYRVFDFTVAPDLAAGAENQ